MNEFVFRQDRLIFGLSVPNRGWFWCMADRRRYDVIALAVWRWTDHQQMRVIVNCKRTALWKPSPNAEMSRNYKCRRNTDGLKRHRNCPGGGYSKKNGSSSCEQELMRCAMGWFRAKFAISFAKKIGMLLLSNGQRANANDFIHNLVVYASFVVISATENARKADVFETAAAHNHLQS